MKVFEPRLCIIYLVWINVFLCHDSSDEVCPLHSWLCGFRSSLRDALERFTETTTARPCGPRPGMYPSDELHLILVCFYPYCCICDLSCNCCCPPPCSPSLPSFHSTWQAGHTPLRETMFTEKVLRTCRCFSLSMELKCHAHAFRHT